MLYNTNYRNKKERQNYILENKEISIKWDSTQQIV